MFNDMLGSTLGVNSKEGFSAVKMTAFGETENKEAMFTGKPYIGELGYAFLFRNYRAEQGKWNSQDPIDYPDGWNNLAYVNNSVIAYVDWLGCVQVASGSYNAGSLWSSKYDSGHPDWKTQINGNSNVSYIVNADIRKDKSGISVSNIRPEYNSQKFSILYFDDANNNGIPDKDAEGRYIEATMNISGISGIVTAGGDSSVTSKKNEDGSTTYYLELTVTVIEKVTGSDGNFYQTRTYTYKDSHTVPE
ncbi:hypothetical protein SDC9_165130 [bioreactor metagenome]|uniref:Uncharacterized protein n=1 Tax=bioreactor metagenome TaxID=1076179 RepID=A0A645FTI9_9ZZZZ